MPLETHSDPTKYSNKRKTQNTHITHTTKNPNIALTTK